MDFKWNSQRLEAQLRTTPVLQVLINSIHFIQLLDEPATLIRHLIDSLCGDSLLNSTIFRFSESSAGPTTEYTTVKQNINKLAIIIH